MGLSGRKEKQRIGPDPRNLAWADDASKFGQSYLSKFGWDSSQGLGAIGDGRTSHIKVQQKLDLMGIGAQHQKDPNGIAWKQNKEFENVLQKLNASMGDDGAFVDEATVALGGTFISATEAPIDEETQKDKKKKEKKDKKRKREIEDAEEKEKKLKTAESEPTPKERVLPRHRAHRARAIAAKNRAFNSASAMSEILGVSSQETTAVPTPVGSSTPITKLDEPPTMEKLTVSTKSVSDYFKERLLAKSSGKTTSSSRDDEASGGIGSGRLGLELGLRGRDEDDNASPSMGLGMSKLGSLMSSAFMATTNTMNLAAPPVTDEKTKVEKKKKTRQKDDKMDDAELAKKKGRKKEKKERKEKKASMAEMAEAGIEQELTKEERKRLKAERKVERKRQEEL